MQIIGGTLARYFGLRFLSATVGIFAGILALSVVIDYVELMRRASDVPTASPGLVARIALFRLPQLGERLMPFCVLIGTMFCYLNFSRRNELVVARAAGVSLPSLAYTCAPRASASRAAASPLRARPSTPIRSPSRRRVIESSAWRRPGS